jgi:F0F1-type ATP synthase delta subunit
VEHLKLSHTVVSQNDIARLQRELNGLNDFFVSARARQTGTGMRLPRLTRLLNQLAAENRINLLEDAGRQKLADGLAQIYDQAPSLHISFASEPSPKALETLVVWVRQNIHAHALIQIGLQPSIAAGCFVRTSNKVFDMSLRATLKKSQPYLTKLIAGAVDGR